MSIMDRNEIVRISRLVAFGRLARNDLITLFIEYCCVEFSKPVEATMQLISIVSQNSILLSQYLNEILEYYERKFTIYKLYSSDKQGRKLLQIF